MCYTYLVDCPVGLLVVRIMAMVRRAVVWGCIVRRRMRMIMVLFEVDDAII
jgi:hypothetical protein